MIERKVLGPSAETRRTALSQLWGCVTDGERSVEGTLTTPEGYELTARTAVEAARLLVEGENPTGAHTPATAFGKDFITTFEGCDLRIGA
jgi:short subunit dehydrogenase-like uncharacterized protein